MGDAAPRRRVKWGRWALVGAVGLLFAPIVPVTTEWILPARPDSYETDGEGFESPDSSGGEEAELAHDDFSILRTEWVSLTGSQTRPVLGWAVNRLRRDHSFLGYDYPGGDDAARWMGLILAATELIPFQREITRDLRRVERGWLALHAGDPDRAEQIFIGVGAHTHDMGVRVDATHGLLALVRAHDAAGRRREVLRTAWRARAFAGESRLAQAAEWGAAQAAMGWGEPELVAELMGRSSEPDYRPGEIARMTGDAWAARFARTGDAQHAEAALRDYAVSEAGLPPRVDPTNVYAADSAARLALQRARMLAGLGRCEAASGAIDDALARVPAAPEWRCPDRPEAELPEVVIRTRLLCDTLSLGGRDGAEQACAEAAALPRRNCLYSLPDHPEALPPPAPLACFAPEAAASAP